MTLLTFMALQLGDVIQDAGTGKLVITGTTYYGKRVHAVYVLASPELGVKGDHFSWVADHAKWERCTDRAILNHVKDFQFDYDQIATEVGNADTLALMNKTLAGRA